MSLSQRIVCWFSCGAASAVATKLAIVNNAGKLPLVVARCIVVEEHEDNDRFARDCEKWFGVPITNLRNDEYNASIYEVFDKRKYISGIKGAPCTRLLKKEVRERFEMPNDIHVFGYCADEQSRYDRFIDANNIDVIAPLIDAKLKHTDCLALVQSAGIALPVMYELGYKHNNCIGCCKATGAGYWNKIRSDFPDMFDKMARKSAELNVRMVIVKGERIYLRDLPPGAGNYKTEPETQCGPFCEAAAEHISKKFQTD